MHPDPLCPWPSDPNPIRPYRACGALPPTLIYRCRAALSLRTAGVPQATARHRILVVPRCGTEYTEPPGCRGRTCPDLFRPIIDSLLYKGDYYCLLADFESYANCQQEVSEVYKDQKRWIRMSILNVANSGKFSTDRTIQQYTDEIWNVKPVPINMDA